MTFPIYLLNRLIQFPVLVLIVIVVNFGLIHLAPGDIAIILAGENPDPEYMAQIRAQYRLDDPFLVQLWNYIWQVLGGNLGQSYRSRSPVLDELWPRIGPTLLLVGCALFISVVAGTWLGTVIARRPGSWLDSFVSTLSVSLFSIPVFWLGLMLILFFAVRLGWLPASGMTRIGGPRSGPGYYLDVAAHLVLPTIALSCVWIGQYIRLARTSVAEVMAEPYITTARAIGFKEGFIMRRYALRNAMLPVVTVLGMELGLVLTGAVLTETVFSWPGMGREILNAIMARDTPVIMGAFILASVTVAAASLLADILYAVIDPRVTYK